MIATVSKKGWMDEISFQAWLLTFIRFLESTREGALEYHLLLDGHSSRFNIDTLFTAAVNRIIVFAGPSQLTNLWQANDSGTNKKIKDNLKLLIGENIEDREGISKEDLGQYILEAIESPNMKMAIVNSFRHVGVCPLDRSVIETMIASETANPEGKIHDLATIQAINYAASKISEMENLRANRDKRKREEKAEKPKK